MATAALVLGIISIILCWFGPAGWTGSVCGILAIIFGAIAMKKGGDDAKKAKVGLILGIIALAAGIILTIACVACVGAAAGAAYNSGLFD